MTSRWRGRRLIVVACVCCLVSLAMMNWAMVDPRPLVVIAAMSVGQGLGIFGVFLYLVAVLRDLRKRLASETVAAAAAPNRDEEPPSTPDAS